MSEDTMNLLSTEGLPEGASLGPAPVPEGKPAEHYIEGIVNEAPHLLEIQALLNTIKENADNAFFKVNREYMLDGRPLPHLRHKPNYYIDNDDVAVEWRKRNHLDIIAARDSLGEVTAIAAKLHAGKEHIDTQDETQIQGFSGKIASAIKLLESAADQKTWEKIHSGDTMREAKRAADYLRETIQRLIGDGHDMVQKLKKHDKEMVERTAKYSPETQQALNNHDFSHAVGNILASERRRKIIDPEAFRKEEKEELSALYKDRMKDPNFREREEEKALARGKPSELSK